MKNIFLLILCLTSFNGFSQMKNWYRADLGTLGYKYNKVLFEKRDPNYTSPTYNYQDSNWLEFKGGTSELSADIFTKHTYFHIDASILTDLTIAYLTSSKKREEWWFNQEGTGKFDQGKFLPMRFAFGGNITKYVNLYAGGQWQYSSYNFEAEDENKYENTFIGGRQMGIGAHLAFSYGPVLIRQSYMIDWISRAGGMFKGNSTTHETALYIGYKKFGLFAKFNYQMLSMKEGTFSESYKAHFKNDLKPTTRFYQAQNMKVTTFSFGIFATGLISGISRGISSSVADTEIKKRNERIRKKKNTIEWKE